MPYLELQRLLMGLLLQGQELGTQRLVLLLQGTVLPFKPGFVLPGLQTDSVMLDLNQREAAIAIVSELSDQVRAQTVWHGGHGIRSIACV